VKEMVNLLPMDQLLGGGLIDYALGAEPHTGAFVLVYEEHPKKRKELAYYKMGDGPLYAFYTPYHLPHIQIASTIARAALFGDATVTPIGAPVCEVAATAKRDLKAGEVLDGVGGFVTYGVIENAPAFIERSLLPMGIVEKVAAFCGTWPKTTGSRMRTWNFLKADCATGFAPSRPRGLAFVNQRNRGAYGLKPA
jgi:predicted homoserine dehydrogenase-like protein